MAEKVNPDDVIALRELVQSREGIGITEAQNYCAIKIFTSLRSWQQWEREERRMHRAFFEYAKIKLASHP